QIWIPTGANNVNPILLGDLMTIPIGTIELSLQQRCPRMRRFWEGPLGLNIRPEPHQEHSMSVLWHPIISSVHHFRHYVIPQISFSAGVELLQSCGMFTPRLTLASTQSRVF